MSGEVRDAGNDATAPMIDDLLRLTGEHFAGELQIALIFVRESRAGLQLLQVQCRERRVLAANIPLEGAADHGVSESIYLRDPDDNGVELYCDKPKEMWPRTPDGQLATFTRRLDLHQLLSEAPQETEVGSGPRDL
jgi:hypothetical protein